MYIHAKAALGGVNRGVQGELDAFQRDKVSDLTDMFKEWARVQAAYHTEMFAQWKGIEKAVRK